RRGRSRVFTDMDLLWSALIASLRSDRVFSSSSATQRWTSALSVATIKRSDHEDCEGYTMMLTVPGRFRYLNQLTSMMLTLLVDTWRFLVLCLRPIPALAAENLYLRKQLALYAERQVKPRRTTNATRLAMVWLSYWFDWRSALCI